MRRLALLVWLLPFAAAAHDLRPSYLELTPRPGERGHVLVDVVWKVALSSGAPLELAAKLPDRCRAVTPTATALEGSAKVSRWTADCGAEGLAGGTVGVNGLADSGTDVLVRVAGGPSLVLRGDSPAAVIPASGGGTGVLTYLPLGVEHIWFGTDHLLFVLGLMLLVGRRMRLLLWTITSFTLAHSVTLATAALGLVTFPTRAVEAIIALSILLLAWELTRPDRDSLASRWPWVFALVCGLLHGFGFAGALAEVGLPPGDVPAALFLFNVGVELGQLSFVGVALLVLRGAEKSWARPVVIYAMGAVSAYWLFARAAPIVLSVVARGG